MRVLVALTLVLAAACGGEEAAPVRGDATLTITTEGGPRELAVQVADTAEERAVGLMGREDLAPFDGMAFAWDRPTESTFWMKDTLIPLSIAFWNERGRIVTILDMEPCPAEPCESYAADAPYVGAVEVEQGRLDELGVRVGDRVVFDPIGS